MLSKLSGISCEAAETALVAGRGPTIALSFLERGRGLLLTSLELRSDIKSLRRQDPLQADRLDDIRRQLDLPRTTKEFETKNESAWEAAQVIHKLEQDLRSIIAETQQQPNFGNFLHHPGDKISQKDQRLWQAMQAIMTQMRRENEMPAVFFPLLSARRWEKGGSGYLVYPMEGQRRDEILELANEGPMIVVNAGKYCCDAIVVEKRSIFVVELPSLNMEELDCRSHEPGSLENLEWLWDAVAKPVLDKLDIGEPLVEGPWTRVWWILTGSLTRFPIHAAGRHSEDGSRSVMDRVISSYVPSLKALASGRSRPCDVSLSHQALLVTMERTPQSPSLPFVKREVATQYSVLQSMGMKSVQPPCHKEDVMLSLSRS